MVGTTLIPWLPGFCHFFRVSARGLEAGESYTRDSGSKILRKWTAWAPGGTVAADV